MSLWTLTARYVFPVDAPPLARGVVTIAGDKIVAVETRGTRSADVDLGNAAILPGLVNAHTHLDLTGLRGQCPPTPEFTQWLRGVIAHRRRQSPQQIAADIQTGINESIAAGTTLVGDIAADGASWPMLTSAPLRSVVFHELLGLPRLRADQAFERGCAWLNTHVPTENCKPALSPHAPYSVHTSVFERAAGFTNSYDVPLATHLAETREELQLLAQRSGPFVAFLEELGVWGEEGLATSPEEVIKHCLGAGPLLLIHCNYLSVESELHSETTIVYCPRTHAAFGHPPHPFRAFLKRGVRVALGTDSLASNPDLDILAEIRFVHERHPDVPGETLLRMGTLAGAEALGWAHETGSLTPGKSADLVVLPLPNENGEPHDLLLKSSKRVACTLFRGAWTASPPGPAG
jgi:cytosine/adenosine deaminase-related metal-dependent hydrolase